jgi:hypothetical protein
MAGYWRRYPRIWGDPPLPPGTEVVCRVTGARGRVMNYDCSVGQFPVRWQGGMWETCVVGDVRVIWPPVPMTKPSAAPAEVCVFQHNEGGLSETHAH